MTVPLFQPANADLLQDVVNAYGRAVREYVTDDDAPLDPHEARQILEESGLYTAAEADAATAYMTVGVSVLKDVLEDLSPAGNRVQIIPPPVTAAEMHAAIEDAKRDDDTDDDTDPA